MNHKNSIQLLIKIYIFLQETDYKKMNQKIWLLLSMLPVQMMALNQTEIHYIVVLFLSSSCIQSILSVQKSLSVTIRENHPNINEKPQRITLKKCHTWLYSSAYYVQSFFVFLHNKLYIKTKFPPHPIGWKDWVPVKNSNAVDAARSALASDNVWRLWYLDTV